MTDKSAPHKRTRGRPPGTGLDDTKTMAAVADLVVASENDARKVTPSGAMKLCVKGIEDHHLRRLQVKWKAGSERLKAEAQERIRAKEDARNRAVRGSAVGVGFAQSYLDRVSAAAAAASPMMHAMTARQLEASGLGTPYGNVDSISKTSMGPAAQLTGAQFASATKDMLQASQMPEYARALSDVPWASTFSSLGQLAETPLSKAVRDLQEAASHVDLAAYLRRYG